MEDKESFVSDDHGWKKVTYVKKKKKKKKKPHKKAAGDDNVELSKRRRNVDLENGYNNLDVEKKEKNNEKSNEKKDKKAKKPKKAKVTIPEASRNITPDHLSAFLKDVAASYESNEEIQLMRFADYFGKASSDVSGAEFPWLKMLREQPLAKIADIPISHISEPVHKTSVEWISHRSHEALGSFVLSLLQTILSHIPPAHQSASKASNKLAQQTSSNSQVASFLLISMVLRRKPDVLINILPTLKENPKYQGQDKLLVIVWMIVQASEGDLTVGLYLWGHHTLPLLRGKQGSNPQSRDLVLQLAERILSVPKARSILVNGAVRKGDRLLPPYELDLLLRLTFPPTSSRVKATERFEAIYPTLKAVALAGSPGSKAMKQVLQQIMTFTLRAACEGVPELSKEASNISIWCISASPDSFKYWDKLYMDNIEASVAILKKLSVERKGRSAKQLHTEALVETLKSFRKKNEKALNGGVDVGAEAVFKEADKYCKLLLGRFSRGNGCLMSMALIVVALAIGATIVYLNVDTFDLDKLLVYFDQQ